MSIFQVCLNNGVQGNLDVIGSTSTAGGVPIVDTVSTGAPTGIVTAGTLPSTQSVYSSLQRTVYIMGPRKINRELKDGTTFTDCNYWKRYCDAAITTGGGATSQTAILRCIYDDGTVWSDDQSENSFPKAVTLVATTNFFPVPGHPLVNGGSLNSTSYTNGALGYNAVNLQTYANLGSQMGGYWGITALYGQPAYFLTISNDTAQAAGTAMSGSIAVRLNGDNGAIFTVPGGGQWIFNQGDCQISSIEVALSSAYASGIQDTGSYQLVSVVAGIRSVANS